MGYLYFVIAIIAALGFYWLRSHHRVLYGASEVFVGLVILAVRFLVPGPVLLTADDAGSALYDPLTTIIGLFTGIYAIVRGLDNIFGSRRG